MCIKVNAKITIERYIKDKLRACSLISKKVYFRKGLLIQNSCIISRKSYKYVIKYLAFWPGQYDNYDEMNAKKQKGIHDDKFKLMNVWCTKNPQYVMTFNDMLTVNKIETEILLFPEYIESPFPMYYMLNI